MDKQAVLVANTGFALYNFRLPLMKYLRDKGWSVTGIANDEADYSRLFDAEGIKFISVPIDHKGKKPLSDLLLIKRLAVLYRNIHPSFVHHFTIKPVIFGSLAAKLSNVPHIFNTITGLGYSFERRGFLRNLVISLYRLALTGRPKVIFQNSADRTLFISLGIASESNAHVVLGSGVDTGKIRPVIKSHMKNEITFLMVSRMLWSKGVKEFVTAAKTVKSSFPFAHFIMAGGVSGGGAKGNPAMVPGTWLKEINSQGVVKWMDRMPFQDILQLLDDADVSVLPSYSEGLPKSLIEAAAKGKPIITTDIPGCRDVVIDGFNGYLIPPKNDDLLAARMINFINKPDLINSMGARSRERAVKLFDSNKIIADTIKIYNDSGLGI